jgi:NADPH-dependent glutamate synthase beta subunit-like oxidoreductase
MIERERDIAPVIDLTREKGTGAERVQRPVYVDLLPPCNSACPAGEDIQTWLAFAQAGRWKEAWEALVTDNPLPAVHGRVCYHPCESSCNRKELDGAVSIHAIERFLGDMALRSGWRVPLTSAASGKRVLIVGAGPSGLSAAYHLRRLGHDVEIHDAGPLPGGMLHFGIPAYRLPRADLMAEINRIEELGVRIVLNHKVEDVLAEKNAGRFDAVFIAIGAHLAKHVDIPARDAVKVYDAVSLLHDVGTGARPVLGRRVVIYGGGNTAMDAARTAKRLGATEALIVYRRDRAHMPAHPFEADEALTEGVKIQWLRTIKEIDGGDLTVEVMQLDADGRPQPTGKFEKLSADAVVLALGQDAESGFLHKIPEIAFQPDGTVIVGPNMMTGRAGIFAGGDMVPSERTVTIAVGHGKKAARHIDAWLRATVYASAPKHDVVTFDMLKLPMFTDVLPNVARELQVAERTAGFEEVVAGLTAGEAVREAMRCLSCGNCYECDNCLAACPEDAIVKLGLDRGYDVDFERCTGCAICVDQCPCHAMEMIGEPVR